MEHKDDKCCKDYHNLVKCCTDDAILVKWRTTVKADETRRPKKNGKKSGNGFV